MQITPELGLLVLSIVIGLIVYIGKGAIDRLDTHIKECNFRAVKTARMNQWMADSLESVGHKLGARITNIPVDSDDE